ncbi:MAG TPA: AI-2E family transporter [Casimicrobiaceae bacterium]|nr:AI-2E family transporter [Casimicrobiaceae bacterium]
MRGEDDQQLRTRPRVRPGQAALIVLAVLAVIGAAKIGAAFLIPLVVGILISYALEPIVRALHRLHIPRAIAAGIVLLLVAGGFAGAGFFLREDAAQALAQLPEAARKLRIAAQQSARMPSPMGHVREAAAELNKAASEATGTPPPPAPPVISGTSRLQAWIAEQSGNVLGVMSELGIALLLAYFVLAQGDAFRRKIVHLAGSTLRERRVTVEILDDIHAQVQRYLLVMAVVNTCIGFATWGVLSMYGIEQAGLWGVIAAILHIIPYAGTAMTMAGVGVVAFLQAGSFSQALLVAFSVMVVAAFFGIGMTSWLQGKAAHMNTAAVFVSLLFFGWLWGGWGLLVGAPLVAVLKTIAERIPALHPLGELLG